MTRAVIASGHPSVCEAASMLLRAGGNAFDAAAGAGFAAAVAEPMLTSLGGGGFLLARNAAGRERLFDFFVDTPGRDLRPGALEPHMQPMTVRFPGSEQVFNIGLGSVAVPGTLRGLLHVHEHLGSLPLAEVVAPAVALARDGVALNHHQAYAIALLEPINTLTSTGRALYAPAGRVPREGERLGNPQLAAFLETLPRDGDREFYEGSLAEEVVREMREGRGLVTRRDLAAYAVIERPPLRLRYRGFRLLTNPPPSFGGSLVALALRLHGETPRDDAPWGSARELQCLCAVMVEVERQRALHGESPVPLDDEFVRSAYARLRRASGGTTHVSISDAQGNAASLSLSNGEGSGHFVRGTGIMLNNMLGEDDLHPRGFHASPAGQRVASMMSPSLVLRDGGVRLILGSGGSKRIRTALVQVIRAVVDFGMGVGAAVEAPRLHWDGECVQAEPGFAEEALAALRRRWPVNVWPERNLYFGGVHAVDPAGSAAGDPRRAGHALVL